MAARASRRCDTELLSWRLLGVNRSVDIMLVRLINRLGKAVWSIVGALLLLRLSGFDLTAVLTGTGPRRCAIAFAARKTLENLFGGIMVISDKPIQVGDFCRAGEFLEWWRISGFDPHDCGLWTAPSFPFPMANWPQ